MTTNRLPERNVPARPPEVGVRPVPARPPSRSPLLPWLIRLPLLGLTALVMLFFVAAIFVALHQINYDKMIYPGVSAYGINLGGMSRAQAVAALSGKFTYGSDAIFTFRYGAQYWQKNAAELGVSFDPAQTIDAAFKVGRDQGLLENLRQQSQAWTNGTALQPTITYDQSKASALLAQIATEINRPMQDATILVQGSQVVTTPSQIGREVDINATLERLREVVVNLTTGAEIPLLVKETAPALAESETVAAQIRAALSSPIELYMETVVAPTTPPTGETAAAPPVTGPWNASTDFIAGLFTIKRVDNDDGTAKYELTTNTAPLKAFLSQLTTQLEVQPINARFLFNDATGQLDLIKESVDGRVLNTEATVSAFEAALFRADNRRVPLVFEQKLAAVNSKSTAAELGITEEIVRATTFFYGSSLERRKNIQVAASRFHGLVIAPGEEFSFNKYLGDVSPESGFETGLVIFGDRTIQGVGGGVCQVSSTVFQAAFYAGFPIVERYAHGYRVGYYESGSAVAAGRQYKSGVGMDATVYSPIIDFRFRNDTPYFLLMETYYEPNKQSLMFKLYSTGTGRVVSKDGPTLTDVVPHGPPKYSESADLRAGESRQVDFAVDGVDVRVYRTIEQNGTVTTSKEEFYSHYLPWSSQFLVAPGAAPRQ